MIIHRFSLFITRNKFKITFEGIKQIQNTRYNQTLMSKTNHFVIRNGKLVPKDQSGMYQQNKSQDQPKLNIIKPIAILLSTEEPKKQSIAFITQAYDKKIQQYEQKIIQLQEELKFKNELIIQYYRDYCTPISYSKINKDSHKNISNLNEIKNYENNLKAENSFHGFLTDRTSYSQNQNNIRQSKRNMQQCKNQQQNEYVAVPRFDSSRLIKRLSHSQNLVNNIKKFLEKTQKNQTAIDSNNSSDEELDFMNELLNKHKSILLLLDKIQREKCEQIRQICEFYENILVQSGHKNFSYINKKTKRKNVSEFSINEELNEDKKKRISIDTDITDSLELSHHAKYQRYSQCLF